MLAKLAKQLLFRIKHILEKKKSRFSQKFNGMFLEIYQVHQFIMKIFKEIFVPPYEGKEILRQCYQVGYKSLALISLTGFITGIVFTKQSRPSLAEFGATSWLPSLVGIALLRTLAPLLTALISAGKVGSSIGAELGSMKVTEQIDAMEVSATNPFKFLVLSRVMATTLTIPILTFYTALVGLLGGFLNVSLSESTSFSAFIQSTFDSITFLDISASTLKSIVFGFTIGVVGCYQGYYSSKGTEGVGKAANSAVVIGMFLIFIEEVIATQITFLFRT